MTPALTPLKVRLEASCNGGGWSCVFITQPLNSPDANFNDLGLFHSIKTMARQAKTHCATMEETTDNAQTAFDFCPREKTMGAWACRFNSLRGVVSKDGGDDYN